MIRLRVKMAAMASRNLTRGSSVNQSTNRLSGLAAVGPALTAVLLGLFTAGNPARAQDSQPAPKLWDAGVGEGFARGATELGLSAGAGLGVPVFGGGDHHDWGMGMAQYGWVLGEVVGLGHWYRGNWELVGEFFGGRQFHPDSAYLVGLAPLLRYDFATGSRWVPFLDLGGGVTATDIRDGDLSTTFEFNLQAAAGTRLFLRDNLALTFQARFLHISNSGIDLPNSGLNNVTFLLGMTWLF
jgi:hypothetical protein